MLNSAENLGILYRSGRKRCLFQMELHTNIGQRVQGEVLCPPWVVSRYATTANPFQPEAHTCFSINGPFGRLVACFLFGLNNLDQKLYTIQLPGWQWIFKNLQSRPGMFKYKKPCRPFIPTPAALLLPAVFVFQPANFTGLVI